MIIVAGWLQTAPGERRRFLEDRTRKILHTRQQPGCIAYSLSADPIEPDVVRVFECWETRRDLNARREKDRSAPITDASLKSVGKDIRVYEVSSSAPLD